MHRDWWNVIENWNCTRISVILKADMYFLDPVIDWPFLFTNAVAKTSIPLCCLRFCRHEKSMRVLLGEEPSLNRICLSNTEPLLEGFSVLVIHSSYDWFCSLKRSCPADFFCKLSALFQVLIQTGVSSFISGELCPLSRTWANLLCAALDTARKAKQRVTLFRGGVVQGDALLQPAYRSTCLLQHSQTEGQSRDSSMESFSLVQWELFMSPFFLWLPGAVAPREAKSFWLTSSAAHLAELCRSCPGSPFKGWMLQRAGRTQPAASSLSCPSTVLAWVCVPDKWRCWAEFIPVSSRD